MLIRWLNKRVSHGSGVGAGMAPWHRGCTHTGVASRHSSSQSRSCGPVPISYEEQETRGCLPVQRSTPPRWEHLWREEQNEGCTWKPHFPPTHTRESKEKTKADRGLSPGVWFWFSFMKEFSSKAMRRKVWASFARCLPRKELGVSRTISGWRTGCFMKLLATIHPVMTVVSNTQCQDKAERLNHPDDF